MDSVNPFKEKIVHLDLKGAPPKLRYYAEFFPLLKQLNVNAILVEFEDMFPYKSDLEILKRQISYTDADLEAIQKLATDNGLEIIPLIQTFGHMEFVLKHPKYSIYREDMQAIDTICPSDNGSWHIISEMLRQVHLLHPYAKRLHIGADEAFSIGKDDRCKKRLIEDLNGSLDRLKLSHITRVAEYARNELGFEEVLAWNDMFDQINVTLLKEYKMGELITPVIWGYAIDVTVENYFPKGLFTRYSQVFPKMLFGSAFKGANGQSKPFCNILRYLANQKSYVQLYKNEQKDLVGRISGIVLTGWQRYSHNRPLCEILPVSVPSLVTDLIYLNNTSMTEQEIVEKAKKMLACLSNENTSAQSQTETKLMNLESNKWISLETMFMNCSFPGSEIYNEMEKLHQNLRGKGRLNVDLESIRDKIRTLLQPYFHDESISEIVESQLSAENIEIQ